MSNTTPKKSSFGARIKESLRKMIVTLKRKPHIIPGIAIAIAFLLYSLNLTDVSDTTAKIQGAGMGLCGFCTMLFSILSFVCFLNAFPARKKVNIPMLILMFLMLGVIVYCDIHYMGKVLAAVTRADNPIPLNANTAYINQAYNMLNAHIICIAVSAGLIILMPLYKWLLKKINTSVEVEDNASMAEIDISAED